MGLFGQSEEARLLEQLLAAVNGGVVSSGRKLDSILAKIPGAVPMDVPAQLELITTILNQLALGLTQVQVRLQTLDQLHLQLRRLNHKAYRPGPLRVVLSHEVYGGNEMDLITYEVVLPALASGHDVAVRRLTVNGVTQDVDPSQEAVGGFEGVQDSEVIVSLIDVDDAGNESQSRELTATLVDTFEPAIPGELTLRATGERTVEDSAPEPEPEPEPTPEEPSEG